MKSNRKEFLKLTGMAGLGAISTGLFGCQSTYGDSIFQQSHSQKFNMSGFAAQKLDIVRVGIIGIGNRGSGGVRRLTRIEGVEITALCDVESDRVDKAMSSLKNTQHNPEKYHGSEDSWKKLCESDDVDLVYICTPWKLHASQAIHAMEHGKHVAVELPAAETIEDCWRLVETSERTKKHCMMLGNVCYDFFEMTVLNMARHGFFGEIIHGEGAYIHDLVALNFSKDYYHNNWRLKENSKRDGNLYTPHAIGPIAKLMNINCGDKMDYLVSMSGNDFTMNEKAIELASNDDFWEPYVGRNYRGNMNTTTIRTAKGRTIMLQHDVSSPRPYSRIFLVSGTDGIARKWPGESRVAKNHSGWLSREEFEELQKEYTPEIVKLVGDMAREVGGHGGMDTIMDWRLIDCLRNGIPLDMDVYDAALWSAVGPLSEWSVANRSNSIDIPDFTGGSWQTNKPGLDINLEKGGNTRII